MKRYVLVFSALGLVGCFLPLVTWRGTSISVFDLRYASWRPYVTMLAFALPALIAWRGTSRATAKAGFVCFGYLALKLGPKALDLVLRAGLGGKLIGIAVVGGVLATIGLALEPVTRGSSCSPDRTEA
ncbi:MAG TPA: hypothetical protein VFQ53_08480 [Kofleriaceae bacterium]|nr:hypothetical protein [Kofleriaceae bacterium]